MFYDRFYDMFYVYENILNFDLIAYDIHEIKNK